MASTILSPEINMPSEATNTPETDNNIIIDNSEKTSHSSSSSPPTTATTSWNPLTEIDSALLSALCDSRERKALLRLEQSLVDFTKDPSLHSIEVGGAYNSIVLGKDEGVDRGLEIQKCMNAQNISEFQFQQTRGMRQTSFQRLILHRLADRFNIVREVIPQNENVVTVLNLIRLVKTDESIVPSRLLIDVDLGLLIEYKNPLARSDRQGMNNGYYSNGNGGEQEDVKPISEPMASSTSESNLAINMNNKMVNKKMVIMKRDTSGSSNNNDKTKKEGKSRNSRKKLVDKEKAYEEARARIFGIDKSSEGSDEGGNSNDDEGDEKAQKSDKAQLNPEVAAFSPQSSFGESRPPTASLESEPNVLKEVGKEQTCEQSNKERAEEDDSNQNIMQTKSPSETQSNNSTKSTGKAVYRNRQQEEADPDFRRRSGPSYYTNTAPMQYGQNPYAQNNPYVNVAMGQHYYGQHTTAANGAYPYHPNHLPTPQSPTFFMGAQNVYPIPKHAPNKVAVQDAASHSDVVATNKANESDKPQPQIMKPKGKKSTEGHATVSNNNANMSVRCSAQNNVTLKPEDFPALR